METKQVSRKLLVRLPIYLEYLKSLPESVINVSATRIARTLGLGDVMVRKDLAKISNSGRRKLGYPRSTLIQDIESVLEIHSSVGVVVVGTGKMGQALLEYGAFEQAGLKLLAGFDLAPPERKAAGKPIYTMDGLETFCRLYHVRIGIITRCPTATPSGSATGWSAAVWRPSGISPPQSSTFPRGSWSRTRT